MRHTTITVPDDVEIEIVREDCSCAPGHVCPDSDPFAPGCPRRPLPAPQPSDQG